MENLLEIAVAAVIGLIVGTMLSTMRRGSPQAAEAANDTTDWWELRKSLTGTQLQILQYMESEKEASIGNLQAKFSFIPDRELYYRLEQIYLLGFLLRDRKDGEMTYKLNPQYSSTVEDDKTVMLSGDKD